MNTDAEKILAQLLVDLDDVRLGSIAEPAVRELVRQVGRRELAERAAAVVAVAIETWNPKGPDFTDAIARKAASAIAPQATSQIVYQLLEKYDA